jgi:hypothetical protein
MSELQPEYGETRDLVFPSAYSSAFEPSDFIAESKWFAPIHMRPRWPIWTLERNDHFPPLFCDRQMIGLAGYLFLLIDYPSYDHHTFNPGKLVHTTSLAEDVKLSACGRHSSLCFLFYF